MEVLTTLVSLHLDCTWETQGWALLLDQQLTQQLKQLQHEQDRIWKAKTQCDIDACSERTVATDQDITSGPKPVPQTEHVSVDYQLPPPLSKR